jgi:hypothetical protein
MPAPSRASAAASPWFSDGAILVVANFVAALGNYGFQAVMRRHLAWSEFGYLNAIGSLILFAGVPMTAASLAMTHQLARVPRGEGHAERAAELQAISLQALRRLTGIICVLALLLLVPAARFLDLPRLSLAGLALLWIPMNLWSATGCAWCAGLGRFRLLAALLIATALVRVGFGAAAVRVDPVAEAGLCASIAAAGVTAVVAIIGPHQRLGISLRRLFLRGENLRFGAAALAVAFGTFFFLQGDLLIAARNFPGNELGRYSGAGLLARTVIWASLPLLTVYFTRRSEPVPAPAMVRWLPRLYLAMIVLGVGAVWLLRRPLLASLLGVHDDAPLADLTGRFTLVELPLGALQLLGYHYLAARRLGESLAFGLCALGTMAVLDCLGNNPVAMLDTLAASGAASLVILGALGLVRRVWMERP